jgi:hypothetical protein
MSSAVQAEADSLLLLLLCCMFCRLRCVMRGCAELAGQPWRHHTTWEQTGTVSTCTLCLFDENLRARLGAVSIDITIFRAG